MGLSVDGVDVAAAGDLPLGLPCTAVKSLVDRVALAVFCDVEAARAVSDAVLAQFRALPPSDGPVDPAARVYIAHAAYEAATTARFDQPTSDQGLPTSEIESGPLAVLGSFEVRTRVIVVLHELEGFGIAQIARVVRASEGAVATELFRARRSLASVITAARSASG